MLKAPLFASLLSVLLIGSFASADPMRDNMTLHHLHTLINKSSSLAAEGSNLIMMGQMKMTNPEIDGATISQGMHLVQDAEAVLHFVAISKTLQEIKGRASDPSTVALLKYTEDLINQTASLIQQLKKMPAVPMMSQLVSGR